MPRAMQRLAVAATAAALMFAMSAVADAASKKSKQRNTNVRDAHAEQYPNWNIVTSAPRSRECIGRCGRYNLPPGGGVNYLDGNGAGYYGGG